MAYFDFIFSFKFTSVGFPVKLNPLKNNVWNNSQKF